MPLASGTRLGPYEVLSPIGAGGMGEVYKRRKVVRMSDRFPVDAEQANEERGGSVCVS